MANKQDTQPFKIRIKELKYMKASELTDNTGNFRRHPQAQDDVLRGVLGEVGIAGALLAYHSKRNKGKVTLIDGHERKTINQDQEWPVLITDLSDDEADLILALYDRITTMAEIDVDSFKKLEEGLRAEHWAINDVLRTMLVEAEREQAEKEHDQEGPRKEDDGLGPMDLELMPFEHFDYLLICFESQLDWLSAMDLLGIERRKDPRGFAKIGLGRTVSGRRFLEYIKGLNPEALMDQERKNGKSRKHA